jgi:hypothetical protein
LASAVPLPQKRLLGVFWRNTFRRRKKMGRNTEKKFGARVSRALHDSKKVGWPIVPNWRSDLFFWSEKITGTFLYFQGQKRNLFFMVRPAKFSTRRLRNGSEINFINLMSNTWRRAA